MSGRYEELNCPFCDKGRIACLYFPGAWSIKSTGKTSLPGTKTKHKSSDNWLIQSGCSNCGKSQEDIEKELRKQGII